MVFHVIVSHDTSLYTKCLQAAPPFTCHELTNRPAQSVDSASPQVRQVAFGVGDQVEDSRCQDVLAELCELRLDLAAQVLGYEN